MTDLGDGLKMGGWENEEERKTCHFPLEQVGGQCYDLRWEENHSHISDKHITVNATHSLSHCVKNKGVK